MSALARLTLYKNLLIGQETELSAIRINGGVRIKQVELGKNLRAFSSDKALARLTLHKNLLFGQETIVRCP